MKQDGVGIITKFENMAGNMEKQSITNNIKIPNKNLEMLKKHFSHCFDKNGNFDFEKFKQELLLLQTKNEDLNFSSESYGMDWLGKSYARLLASDEATTLLKENEEWNKKEENKNSENLLIKGDNLEVLKHLSNAYYEKIKMIYIDPPYNTGSDGFVYQDDRKFTVEELSRLAGIDEDKAKRILEFTQSKSNSHSAWLTFMYPRLYIAKQLLKDDGVIFVSIDDNEVAQLRLLMDEIFGEENFVGEIVWQGLDTIKNDAKYFSNNDEYILCYAKNKNNLIIKGASRTEAHNKVYKNLDNDPKGEYLLTPLNAKSGTDNGIYEYVFKNGIKWIPPKGTFPRFSKQTLEELENKNQIYFGKNNESIPQKKTYLNEVSEYLKLTTFWDYKFAGSTRQSNNEIANLLEKGVFQNSKPTKLLKIIINSVTDSSDLILDFFAGSGTTGDAVMQLNAEDGGNRKYILVQLSELIDEKKNKTAYDFVKDLMKSTPSNSSNLPPLNEGNLSTQTSNENTLLQNGNLEPTIFDITKERLVRAAKKIKENLPKNSPLEGWTAKSFETKQDGVESLNSPWKTKSYFPYWDLPKNENLKDNAKQLKKAGILSEVIFWNKFKDKKQLGWDLDRQVIIGDYIVDFFIPELGLVIEIDGESHDFKVDYDLKRENYLKQLDLEILHYKDNEIKKSIDEVCDSFVGAITKRVEELKRKIRKESTPAPLNEGNLSNSSTNEGNFDFGFKIFETQPIWEDYNFEAKEFDDQLQLFDESKLTQEDLKTLLTTWKTYDGLKLTDELKEINLDEYTGYYFDTKLYLMDKNFTTKNLNKLLEEIDSNKNFSPITIIAFGYNFESKILKEIADNIKNYANKKHIDIDFITRY